MIVVISDLHLKNEEVYAKAQKKFLFHLSENYKNEIIVFLGDVFDGVTPEWGLFEYFAEFLHNRNNTTYLLEGNHDRKKLKGSVLQGLTCIENVHVIFEKEIIDIEGQHCLFLPHGKYEDDLSFEGDFLFAHLEPIEVSFGDTGFKHKNIKVEKQVYGHIHLSYHKDNILILGVPIPTRNLELSNKQIKIEKGELSFIDIPEFLRIETIDFNVDINTLNKDWLYNINNCPSKEELYEKFKDFYIRESGIEIERTESSLEQSNIENSGTLLDKFRIFSTDENLSDEITQCGAHYISEFEFVS